MAKQKSFALGRGLDALIPEQPDIVSAQTEGIRMLSVSDIDTNQNQPRRSFDEEALHQLAESIKSSGVLQPLLVVPKGSRYQIVAGERRFRAALEAGLSDVPCVVRDLTPEQQMEASLIENIQREDLNAIEEAMAIRQLMDSFGYTQDKAAQRLGKSRPALANLLRLLTLPLDIQAAVAEKKISAGHARTLVNIENPALQKILANSVSQDNLSVRDLEKIVKLPLPILDDLAAERLQVGHVLVLIGLDDPGRQMELAEQVVRDRLAVWQLEKLLAPAGEKQPIKEQPTPRVLTAQLEDMRDRLNNVLGARTIIKGTEKKGVITINYYNSLELEKIYQCLEYLENR